MKLKDKVVVVTGSTRGIGRAIARACAQQGAKVVISSRKESVVKETCEIFQKEGFKISGIKADVAVTADLIKLFNGSIRGQVLKYNKVSKGNSFQLGKEQGTVQCFYLTSLKPFIYKAFRPPSGVPF